MSGQQARDDPSRDRGWRRAAAGAISVSSQPTTKKTPPTSHGRGTSKASRAETVVRRPVSSSTWTRTFVVVRTISTSPAPGEDARALGVLLEQAADLDRRQPVERERERLEEQEEPRSRSRPARSAIIAARLRDAEPARGRAASSASICPSSVSWS